MKNRGSGSPIFSTMRLRNSPPSKHSVFITRYPAEPNAAGAIGFGMPSGTMKLY
ncbi:unknown [Bifidobacterium bifidum CAG:234]|nr:unknown [Bifidobacterium bifidum CAG:234]